MTDILIEGATLADWPQIEAIYRAGIRTGLATFNSEEDIPGGQTWFASKLPGYVFKAVDDNDQMVGWASLSATSTRRVYAGVAETSVYVAPEVVGRAVGRQLLAHLINESEAAGIWTLVASIFPENEASIRLHLRLGFRVIGRRERIAQLNGVWRDVFLLERRSRVVGAET